MGYVWQRWLADEFRAAGLTVIEVEGWKNRGRPASTGYFDPTEGVTVHHDGATSSPSNPSPALRVLIEGRPDLPGPLCQWSVRHDGVVVVIAAGRANHAGRVGKALSYAALGEDGNAIFLGDEVATNGTQALTDAQIRSIAITNRVVLDHFRNPVERVHRHADISGSGKWDIGNRTTQQLRVDVEELGQEDDMSWSEEIPVIGVDKSIAARNMLQQAHNRAGVARQKAASAEAFARRAEAIGVANGRKLDVLLDRSLTEAQRNQLIQAIATELAQQMAEITIHVTAEVRAAEQEENQ